MDRRAATRAAIAALALLLAGSAGPAYLVRVTSSGTEFRWNLVAGAPNVRGGKVTYYVDTSGVQDVTGAQFAAAVRAAVQSWEDVPGSALAFEEDPSRPANGKDGSDRVNRFGFGGQGFGPFVFAVTFSTSTGSRLLDCDVVFNPDMSWSVASPGNPSAGDVEGVAAHEWGHGIGMDHVPLSGSTMYFAASLGAVSLRSLAIDDAAGIAHLYPGPSLATDLGVLAGRVAVSGTTNDRGIQVTAIDFASGLPAASDFSDPDGSWRIEGLPPGVYRLAASPIGSGQVNGGAYSPWWSSAVTEALPAVRGQDGAADGSTGVHVLAAGQTIAGLDLAVGTATAPQEPNDSTGQARPLAVGASVAARAESSNDQDFYSFAGTAGRAVSIFVHAQQIGSDMDPRVYLRASNGILLAVQSDISVAYTSPGGADLDCRIVDYVLPATGTYYVQVDPEQSVDPARTEDFFYVLTLLEGGGAASPWTSVFTATPAVVPADGASSSALSLEPRTITGVAVGPGRSVSFAALSDGDPDGTLLPVVDNGDGTYGATFVSPSAAGADAVRATVDGVEAGTLTVTWRGPADFAASDFAAAPRRIRFDGTSRADAILFPRDANGVAFGPGRTVSLYLDGAFDATLGPTTDVGDGSYAAVLTAGTTGGPVQVGAQVDGSGLGGTLEVGLGFPLEEIVDAVAAEVGAMAAAPPAAGAAAPLAKARDALLAVAGLPAPAESPAILAGVRKALLRLETAIRKGAGATPAARDLAEAARQAAREAIDAATAAGGDPSKAAALYAKGEARIDEGRWSAAAAKYRAALGKALRALP